MTAPDFGGVAEKANFVLAASFVSVKVARDFCCDG